MSKLKKILIRMLYPNKFSSNAFVNYLKKNGVSIGAYTYFFDPINTKIDIKRAAYLSIGSGCVITSGVQFLCHDYSWSVLRKSHHAILPDPGKTITIGDNVFIGWNALIIGTVKIGSNVIIGANSVVTHDIPDNSVYAGNPARFISTLEKYYEKKASSVVDDAIFRAKKIQEATNRMPTIQDMAWFGVLFLDRNRENEEFLRSLPINGDNVNEVIEDFYNTKPIFSSFDEFINHAFFIQE